MPELTDAQKAKLTKDELSIIEAMPVSLDGNDVIKFAKSLADTRIKSEARRKMLKKRQYDGIIEYQSGKWKYGACLGCGREISDPCIPDCAYALLAEEE